MGPPTDALSVMLPGREHTAFLQACLLGGDALGPAWRAWLALVGDPVGFLSGRGRDRRGHLPLLYRNLTDHGETIPAALRPYLRGALVREQLRFETYDACVRDALGILAAARIDCTVVKGAAAARTLFASPALRHCHDLDLWVGEAEQGSAVAALIGAGFAAAGERAGTTRVDHPKGLPVMLHTRLIDGPFYPVPEEAIRGRRRTHPDAAGAWRVLAPADMLVHVCGHAATARRRPHGNWAVDAHRLSGRLVAGEWDTVVEVTSRARLALPVVVLLRYLRDALAAPVPDAVLDTLGAEADRVDRVHLLAAIDGAWLGRPGGLAAMLRRSSWRSRARVAHGLLFPPASYLRAMRGSAGGFRLAAEYALRPVRFLVRRVWRTQPERTIDGWPGRP